MKSQESQGSGFLIVHKLLFFTHNHVQTQTLLAYMDNLVIRGTLVDINIPLNCSSGSFTINKHATLHYLCILVFYYDKQDLI
jgi:hypothetical protein